VTVNFVRRRPKPKEEIEELLTTSRPHVSLLLSQKGLRQLIRLFATTAGMSSSVVNRIIKGKKIAPEVELKLIKHFVLLDDLIIEIGSEIMPRIDQFTRKDCMTFLESAQLYLFSSLDYIGYAVRMAREEPEHFDEAQLHLGEIGLTVRFRSEQ
jgi:hypothetical protein